MPRQTHTYHINTTLWSPHRVIINELPIPQETEPNRESFQLRRIERIGSEQKMLILMLLWPR